MKVFYDSILKRIREAKHEAANGGLVISHIELTTPEFNCVLRELGWLNGSSIGPGAHRTMQVDGIQIEEVPKPTFVVTRR